MNKRRGSRNRHEGGLAPEYRFDYSKSRPNRFARQVAKNAVVVVLDPDVAAVFRDPKKVNSLLRATIAALKSQVRDGRANNRLKQTARLRSGAKSL